MDANNDLLWIVCINEQVKVIVQRAHSINLLALNSILLSRRAGAMAAGFGVIADELRVFSKTLSTTMRSLMELSFASVGIVSGYYRERRVDALLKSTAQELQNAGLPIATFTQTRADPATAEHSSLQQTVRNLQHLLDEAEEATRFGSVIARSLKIEAAYGREFSAMLTQIAAEFYESIATIPDILQKLHEQIRSAIRTSQA